MTEFYEKLTLAVAPAITERTLLNLRHVLEQQYILSTAQDASEEQRRAYSGEVVAKAEAAAALDNARTIVIWVNAIIQELNDEKERAVKRGQVRRLAETLESHRATLAALRAGTAYPTLTAKARQRQEASHQSAIRAIEGRLHRLSQGLPDLPAEEVEAGRAPQSGPVGREPDGRQQVDGSLQDLP